MGRDTGKGAMGSESKKGRQVMAYLNQRWVWLAGRFMVASDGSG